MVNSFALTPEILWMTQQIEPTGEQSQLIGHGGGSFDYTIAEAAIQQGCLRA
jgi:predicted amidohydrolase